MQGPAPADLPMPEIPVGELTEAVRLLKRASVLVVGDAMLDRYVYGQVERVSPEAPVAVLAVERRGRDARRRRATSSGT
jgi:D-beta-D-heptose 7-phosphate kinase/D-beta-D-heptose 1-phosphate adenosyltransferase